MNILFIFWTLKEFYIWCRTLSFWSLDSMGAILNSTIRKSKLPLVNHVKPLLVRQFVSEVVIQDLVYENVKWP